MRRFWGHGEVESLRNCSSRSRFQKISVGPRCSVWSGCKRRNFALNGALSPHRDFGLEDALGLYILVIVAPYLCAIVIHIFWKVCHAAVLIHAEQQEKIAFLTRSHLKTIESLPSTARPRIAFSTTSAPSSKWASIDGIFMINHLGGDAAQYIQIDPIPCAKGTKMTIHFDQISFVDANHHLAIAHFTLDIAGIKRFEDKAGNLASVFFRGDTSRLNKTHISYPITVKYKWHREWLEDRFFLHWDQDRLKMSTSPWD